MAEQSKPAKRSGRWKSGQSGNPKGRPRKEECLTSLLKEEIEKICPLDKEGRTWAQLLVEATMRLAIKGNAPYMKELWERVDGKVKEKIEVDHTAKVVRLPVTVEDAAEWEKLYGGAGTTGVGAAEGTTDSTPKLPD